MILSRSVSSCPAAASSTARAHFLVVIFLAISLTIVRAQGTPAFSKVIVFGDSLSDVGNIHHRMQSQYLIGYPGGNFNYSDGRFTNSSDTAPSSQQYVGVWQEQLARTFLNLSAATNSLDGGSDYAFGGATTQDGTSERTVFSNPSPFIGGTTSITIDNMGRQIDRYLTQETVDPAALYIVWGGSNDLFDDASAANVTATSHRVVALVNRLIIAGAKHILVPNVPPLGSVPLYGGDTAKQAALDQASADYRSILNADLDANALLSGETPPSLYRLDVWSLFVRFTSNPGSYGITDFGRSAQGRSATNPDNYLFWDDIHPTTAGHFQIAQEAARVLDGAAGAPARALNVSSRVTVGEGENIAVGGFIVTGNAPKRVIVRGIGPSLTSLGVAGALSDPTLALFDQSGSLLATNNNWEDSQQSEIIATGLAPSDRLEAAIVQTLPPGSYTAVLSGAGASTGIGLVEFYDLEVGADSTLANLSTRGFVGTDDNVLIGGLIIGEGDNPIVVLRAIGPDLANRGVANPLQDPILELYDGNGTQIGQNDNWKDGQATAVKAAVLPPNDDRESALVVSLVPGNYTAVVRGQSNTTGVALVEVYRIP